jgi:two-component system chemotaxis response regulator CheB
MAKIRVLVVDDAVVIRRLVSDVLNGEADIDVVGTAANGRIALQKIAQVNPDVITLDVEMPDMDGIETLRQIRQTWTKLPVIMFSTLTERGAAATLDALSAGASDYVTKPANVGSVTTALARVRAELVPKIRALTGRAEVAEPPPSSQPGSTRPASGAPAAAGVAAAPAAAAPPRPVRSSIARSAHHEPEIVAIGVSTGGPNALAALLPALPENFPVPIVVVQHMPPMFTQLLAARLDSQAKVRVVEGKAGTLLEPRTVYIAPGDFHMELQRQGTTAVQIVLTQAPPENSCRPAVDVLFRSVARVYANRILGVILTGMGQDGLRGAELIHEAGGRVLAQDEASSVVWGMPGYVVRAGLADRVLPLHGIAAEIVRRVLTPA